MKLHLYAYFDIPYFDILFTRLLTLLKLKRSHAIELFGLQGENLQLKQKLDATSLFANETKTNISMYLFPISIPRMY